MVFPHGLKELVETYGDPRPLLNANGTIDPDVELAWRKKILKKGILPFPIPLRMGQSEPAKKTFYAHEKVVDTIVMVMEEIALDGLRKHIKSWGGVYNFRTVRNRARLSTHCWGISIDLNPEENGLGTPGMIHKHIVEMFVNLGGFTWGGNFTGRKDPMHFQAVSGY